MYYSSKRDVWLSVVIWGVIGLMIADGVLDLQWGVFMVPPLISNTLFKMVFLLAVSVLLLWVWFRTGYYIGSEWLKVQYGPYKKQIRLEEIEKVVPIKILSLHLHYLPIVWSSIMVLGSL